MPTLQASINVTSTIAGSPYGQSGNTSITTNGIDAIQQTLTISTSSWTNLSFGALPNQRYIAVQNLSSVFNPTSSIIVIATGSAGQYPLGYLQTGDSMTWPWSGSMGGLYAQVQAGSPSPVASMSYTAFQS